MKILPRIRLIEVAIALAAGFASVDVRLLAQSSVAEISLLEQRAFLKSSQPLSTQFFGSSIDICGDVAVVGVPGIYDIAATTSAAIIYERVGEDVWSPTAILQAPFGELSDRFGTAVAIEDDIVIVGAPHEASSAVGVDGDQQDNSAGSSGAAYVFREIANVWVFEAYLKSDSPSANKEFGWSVDVKGQRVIVGEPKRDSGVVLNQGAAHVFLFTASGWIPEVRLYPQIPGAEDRFGSSVAIDCELAVVGAPREASGAVGINGDPLNNLQPATGAV